MISNAQIITHLLASFKLLYFKLLFCQYQPQNTKNTIFVPIFSKLVQMLFKCYSNVDIILDQCCYNIVLIMFTCFPKVCLMLFNFCFNMFPMSVQCCPNVLPMVFQYCSNVLPIMFQCCFNIVQSFSNVFLVWF